MKEKDIYQECFESISPIVSNEFLKDFGESPTDIVLEIKRKRYSVKISLN
ncbi:hypothetical protein [Companilactobacillus muriivasis]